MSRQRRGYLARLHVQPEMDLTPGPPLRVAVLAHLPFASAVELPARTIDNQMNRVAARHLGQRHL